MANARAAWRERQKSLDPTRLVFIDDTGASTKMVRRRGRIWFTVPGEIARHSISLPAGIVPGS